MKRACWLLLLLGCWLSAAEARARIERFAVVVGNDRGLASEVELRYAESDARRVAEVLRELGGVEPVNSVLLAGQDADTLRRTLITVNDRIRALTSEPDTQVVLFVYYSGHADAEALHLGSSRFETAELAQLVRGSAASFRLLVVDACRSGQLTRAKGGKLRAPFPLGNETRLQGEGLAFLTASSAHEDAQESDELRGSFFTHALVSGLLGAADVDDDAAISLEEAYRYAYDATLRATSRTSYGTQHPTFQYDLRGQGNLVLTAARLSHQQRGTLSLPAGLDALIFRGGPTGNTVAEITPSRSARSLSLVPGSYFVRVRGESHLLEGNVQVSAAALTELSTAQLTRVEYARLVRKGQGTVRSVHALELGGQVRLALPNAETPCAGAALGYRLDRERAFFGLRAGFCQSRFESEFVEAKVRELDLALRVGHTWDLSVLSFELGASVAATLFQQAFETEGNAPTRYSLAGYASVFGGLVRELGAGWYASFEVAGQLYVLPLLDEAGDEDLRAAVVPRFGVFIGKQF